MLWICSSVWIQNRYAMNGTVGGMARHLQPLCVAPPSRSHACPLWSKLATSAPFGSVVAGRSALRTAWPSSAFYMHNSHKGPQNRRVGASVCVGAGGKGMHVVRAGKRLRVADRAASRFAPDVDRRRTVLIVDAGIELSTVRVPEMHKRLLGVNHTEKGGQWDGVDALGQTVEHDHLHGGGRRVGLSEGEWTTQPGAYCAEATRQSMVQHTAHESRIICASRRMWRGLATVADWWTGLDEEVEHEGAAATVSEKAIRTGVKDDFDFSERAAEQCGVWVGIPPGMLNKCLDERPGLYGVAARVRIAPMQPKTTGALPAAFADLNDYAVRECVLGEHVKAQLSLRDRTILALQALGSSGKGQQLGEFASMQQSQVQEQGLLKRFQRSMQQIARPSGVHSGTDIASQSGSTVQEQEGIVKASQNESSLVQEEHALAKVPMMAQLLDQDTISDDAVASSMVFDEERRLEGRRATFHFLKRLWFALDPPLKATEGGSDIHVVYDTSDDLVDGGDDDGSQHDDYVDMTGSEIVPETDAELRRTLEKQKELRQAAKLVGDKWNEDEYMSDYTKLWAGDEQSDGVMASDSRRLKSGQVTVPQLLLEKYAEQKGINAPAVRSRREAYDAKDADRSLERCSLDGEAGTGIIEHDMLPVDVDENGETTRTVVGEDLDTMEKGTGYLKEGFGTHRIAKGSAPATVRYRSWVADTMLQVCSLNGGAAVEREGAVLQLHEQAACVASDERLAVGSLDDADVNAGVLLGPHLVSMLAPAALHRKGAAIISVPLHDVVKTNSSKPEGFTLGIKSLDFAALDASSSLFRTAMGMMKAVIAEPGVDAVAGAGATYTVPRCVVASGVSMVGLCFSVAPSAEAAEQLRSVDERDIVTGKVLGGIHGGHRSTFLEFDQDNGAHGGCVSSDLFTLRMTDAVSVGIGDAPGMDVPLADGIVTAPGRAASAELCDPEVVSALAGSLSMMHVLVYPVVNSSGGGIRYMVDSWRRVYAEPIGSSHMWTRRKSRRRERIIRAATPDSGR